MSLKASLSRLRNAFTIYYYPAAGVQSPGIAVHFNPTKLGWSSKLFRRRYEQQRLNDSALFM
jgi:hypothetical protein